MNKHQTEHKKNRVCSLKSILSNILYCTGISKSILKILLLLKPSHFIFMYHRINDDNNGLFPGVAISDFKKQIKVLKKYFRIITLSELASSINKTKKSLAVITFDDGYKSVFTKALPVLKEYNLCATVFIVTGPVDNTDLVWTDKVSLLKYAEKPEVLNIGNDLYSANQLNDDTSLEKIKSYYKGLPNRIRESELSNLLSQVNINHSFIPEEYRMLFWEEIASLVKEGFELGAHTVSHPILTKVTKEQAEKEIIDSKLRIETITGRQIVSFCYPNGRREDFDESTKTILKEAGFVCAVTTLEGKATANDDLFALKRISLADRNPGLITLRLIKEILTDA